MGFVGCNSRSLSVSVPPPALTDHTPIVTGAPPAPATPVRLGASPDTTLIALEAIMALPDDPELRSTVRQLLDIYREFAKDVLIEDSGLAIWSNPNYQLIRTLAEVDKEIEAL